ncbi:MAG: hypothetical protein HC930_08380 [Hydrococcus sp. SU_1_0]|nr:hypothetical protein [Hydrococcus sp. SU_1_0]
MVDFETSITYAENIVKSELPDPPYGIVGNEGNISVDPSKVLLGKDEGIPDALSLPRNAFVTVNFGDYTIVDEEGADIEITTIDGANEFARLSVEADAYYEDGRTPVTTRASTNINVPEGSNEPLLIDLADINLNFKDEEDISFIKVDTIAITGLDNRGTSPGFEVYEIKSINSVDKTTIFNTIDLLERRDPLTGQVIGPEIYSDDIETEANKVFSNQSFLTPAEAGSIVDDYGLISDALIAGFTAAAAGASLPAIAIAGLTAAGFSYLTGIGVSEIADFLDLLYNEGGIKIINDELTRINQNSDI